MGGVDDALWTIIIIIIPHCHYHERPPVSVQWLHMRRGDLARTGKDVMVMATKVVGETKNVDVGR